MTDEEASDQADRVSAALRDTILQLNDDGLDPQCIVETLIVQAVGLAFAYQLTTPRVAVALENPIHLVYSAGLTSLERSR